jgi:hypothetical protein
VTRLQRADALQHHLGDGHGEFYRFPKEMSQWLVIKLDPNLKWW